MADSGQVVEDVKAAPNLEALKNDLDLQIREVKEELKGLGKSALDKALTNTLLAQLNNLMDKRSNVYQTSTSSNNAYVNNSEPLGAARINADLKDVNKFSGKNFDHTESFLDQINQIYDCEVASATNKAVLEDYFMRRVKSSKISREVYDKMKNEGKDVETLSDFNGFIRRHFLPKENPFQIFSKVFDEEWNPPRDKLHVVAQKMDNKAKTACATFKAMWEKEHPGVTPSLEDAFLFASGTHLFNCIKEREPQTARDMVNKLDTVFSATKLAATAQVYRDQNGNASEVLYAKPTPQRRQRHRAPRKNKNEQQNKNEKKETQKAPPKGNSKKVLSIKTESSSPQWRLPEPNQGAPLSARGELDGEQDFH